MAAECGVAVVDSDLIEVGVGLRWRWRDNGSGLVGNSDGRWQLGAKARGGRRQCDGRWFDGGG